LIKSATVGVFIPSVQIVIDTLDSSGKDIAASNLIPVNKLGARRRTRADKPITVYVTTSGLQSGASDPAASKSVTYSHYVQSYGEGDSALNPAQATKLTQSSITTNTTQPFVYILPQVPLVPGSKFSKLRGEERFSVYTLDDYQKKSYELASQTVNVWPVADGKITGITEGQKIRGVVPPITFTYNDIYPDSDVSARCYPGSYVAGKLGELMVGCGRPNSDLEKPMPNFSIKVSSLDSYFPTEGDWTIILVTTSAPYGIEPLKDPEDGEIEAVTFEIRRTLEVNGTLTTSE
jgi:hypothetical protein